MKLYNTKLPTEKYSVTIKTMLNSLPSVHITPLGSGSHSPFSVQVIEFGPTSDRSGGQVKLIISAGKPLSP